MPLSALFLMLLAAPAADLEAIEARRVALTARLSLGEAPLAVAEARSLALAVQGEERAPEWYRDEIEALASSFELIDSLGPADQRAVLDALAARPDPRAGADAAVAALEGHAEFLAEVFGDGHPVVTERYFFLSNVSGQLGRWDAAAAYAREATSRAMELAGERDAQVAIRRMWLGWILRRRGEYAEAEGELLRARATLERLDVEPLGVFVEHRLHATNYLGLLRIDQGRDDEGEVLLRKYTDEAREAFGEQSRIYLGSLNNFAVVLESRGLHADAIAVYSECLARSLDRGDQRDPVIGQLWLNLGNCLAGAGRVFEARGAYEACLAHLDAQGLMPEIALLARASLARVLWRTDEREAAMRLVDEAAGDRERVVAGLPQERAMLSSDLMVMLTLSGRLEEALDVYDEIMPELDPDLLWGGRLRFLRCLVDVREGEFDAALERLDELLPVIDANESVGSHQAIAALVLLGNVHEEHGDLEAAADAYRLAAERYEIRRGAHGYGFHRSLVLERKPFQRLAHVEALQGHGRRAWEALEAGRSRSLYELLSLGASAPSNRIPMQRRIGAIEAQLEALGSVRERSDEAAERIRELRREGLLLRGQLGRLDAGISEVPRTLDAVCATLRADEAIVGWFEADGLGPYGAHGWVLRSDGTLRWTAIAADRGQSLEAQLLAFASELAGEARSVFMPRPESVFEAAAELGDLLFGDFVGSGALDGVEHLVLVPAGFEGVPFAALRVDGRWVADRWTVSHAPSCSTFAVLRERAAAGAHGDAALVIGDPPFRSEATLADAGDVEGARLRGHFDLSQLERLPRTRDEAEAVASVFERATLLTGQDADEGVLDGYARRDQLARFSTIHFATHALVDDVVPERSGVALSQVALPDPFEAALRGQRAKDGFLSAGEIVARWRIEASLVTLSACRSALGRSVNGEGYIGLATAFLQAGARTILASLWDVQDEPTMILMRAFYRNWLDAREAGEPRAKALALQRARREVREHEVGGQRPYAHPAFWSAFVLLGAPD